MKPGSRDQRHKLLICGEELRELQRHTYSMAEAFGLDTRIENYRGRDPSRSTGGLECLLDVIDLALEDDYPDQSAPEYHALKRLGDRLRKEYDDPYGSE